ncbi:hypothetical protein NP493_67g05003 [Ridgeia piscesae]|uniref:Uncharacterized protein n=1 Tax=Ridgeia piscesae TaxID=27915 RepID=A0AAD9UII5_RIDPI|nr:hypothetical protein NP493_67g05003 [Ridgeia piscesae]
MRFVQDDSNIVLLWPCQSDCWADCGPDEPDDEYLPANVTKVCCLDEDSTLSIWTAAIVHRCGNLRFRKEDATSAAEHTAHKPRVERKVTVENTCNRRHVDSCTRALLENLENARRNRKGH